MCYSCVVGAVKKVGISIRVSLTFCNDMRCNMRCNIWMYEWVSSICMGVWDNKLMLGFFHNLSDFVLLFGDLNRISLFWNTSLGHAFGVVRINILNDRYSSLDDWDMVFDNRYNGLDNMGGTNNGLDDMCSVCTDDGLDDGDTSHVVVSIYLWVSFWFSQSDGHKGKQSYLQNRLKRNSKSNSKDRQNC